MINENKATRYHRRRRRAQLLGRLLSAAALLLLIVSGAIGSLAGAAERLAGADDTLWPSVVATTLFALWIALPIAIVRLPFDALGEWALDREYGLERVSLGTWMSGHLRGLAVLFLMLLGSMLVVRAAVSATRAWWLVAAVAVWISHMLWTVVTPTVLRAMNTTRPLNRPHLLERLRQLAARAGAPLHVYEWHVGDDARRADAALVGVGRTPRVILSDTLLESLTLDEIEVVVAHELAHHMHRDAWASAAWRLVVIVASLGGAAVALAHLPAWLGESNPRHLSTLPIIGLCSYAVSALLSPVGLALSRAHERRADAFAIEMTANPEAFLSATRRLSAGNLEEEHPSRLTRLLSSHPSSHERMAAAARRTPAR